MEISKALLSRPLSSRLHALALLDFVDDRLGVVHVDMSFLEASDSPHHSRLSYQSSSVGGLCWDSVKVFELAAGLDHGGVCLRV